MPIVVVGLVAAVVLGGGTSFAANSALPGDILYPVKLGVNETIEGAFAVSDESRADWNIRVAERRLNEASQAAAKGKLSESARLVLEQNFDDHVESVANTISELELKGNHSTAADIAVRLTGVLVKQGTALTKVQSDTQTTADAETKESLNRIAAKIQSTLTASVMIATRASAESAPTSTNSNSKVDANVDVNVNSGGNVNVGL